MDASVSNSRTMALELHSVVDEDPLNMANLHVDKIRRDPRVTSERNPVISI